MPLNTTMRPTIVQLGAAVITLSVLAGCATPQRPVQTVEPNATLAEQRAAQATQQPVQLALKRKIALGRVSNETLHGRSLLRDQHDDPLGKQVTDMLSKALTESGSFL